MSSTMSRGVGRSGAHKTIFGVKRDPKLMDPDIIRDKNMHEFPFVNADKYKGEWVNNVKSGFGVRVTETTRYEGEFKCDKRDGLGTLWMKIPTNKWRKVYNGGWSRGKKEGSGTYYSENGDTYRGEWLENEKSGLGTMEYANGDKFSGSYRGDNRNGPGVLTLANGDVFDGHFVNDLRDGPGRYFYIATVKVYEGEWGEGLPRCGELREPVANELKVRFIDEGHPAQPGFQIPEIELLKPRTVVSHAIAEWRMQRSSIAAEEPEGSVLLDDEELERAEVMFADLDVEGRGLMAALDLIPVLYEVGLDLDEEQLAVVLQQLDLDVNISMSFPEVMDVASFVKMKLLNEQSQESKEDYE